MNTVEEEERQASFVSELSVNPKVSAVKVYHTNLASKDTEVLPTSTDNIDPSIQDLHNVVKINSVIGVKTLSSKYLNHNGDDRDAEDNEELLKVAVETESVKQSNNLELQENEPEEQTIVKPSRVVLTAEQLASLSKEELIEKWNQQESYISSLHSSLESALHEASDLRKSRLNEERLKVQLSEIQKKEQYHIMRLATKEHDIQELGAQIEELKNMTAGGNSLKHSLLDPAVNLLFERMKRDFDSTKAKMEETQNELAAWKFTPDSNTGKQLMAKCRLLIKENEELGKMISSGRLAKLESDLTLQRSFSDELKKSQSELEEFLQEMDEDTEGMQGTILYLQSQLRQAKEKISHLTNQLSLGPTTSNNTPASAEEVPEYPECAFSEMEQLHNEDSLPQYPDEGPRTMLEASSDPDLLRESDLTDESTLSTRPNGDLIVNNSNNHSSCKTIPAGAVVGSENDRTSDASSTTSLKAFSNGRKRTQSVIQEEMGKGEEPRPPTPTKRTRLEPEGEEDGKECGDGEGVAVSPSTTTPVLENGLPELGVATSRASSPRD